ncbi:hypothetical protein [Ferruginibacter sp. SUN106]|uniref:hypothetical protein n=1 Tax=Ferruginibacter sp. SUN106 TaxID=2978348 RepID=UPI003D36D2FE
MRKYYLILVIAVCSCSLAFAQTDSLSLKDKAALDSMLDNDEFLKMMKDGPKSSFDVSIGIGNGAFSSHNNAANATGVDNKMIFTPSLMYRTKSGFSFGVTGFLTSDSAKGTELYQTGLSAGYEYDGKEVTTGITYTRYLSDKNKYNTKSLYQNDIYGFIKKAKGIIQPGLALGFDNGKYKEADLASVILKRPLNPRGDTTITGIDSTDNKTTYFSATASIEHDFSFYKLFSKDDELDFVPSLLLNFGKDDLEQTHTNTINRPLVKKLLARRKKNTPTNKFEMQSIATSLDFTYSVGKFFLQPNLYLDYYLPETTAKRFTAIFSVTAGLSF